MLDYLYKKLLEDLVSQNGDNTEISIDLLKEIPEPSWFLFRYLSPKGFTSSQIADINNSLGSESGRKFSSKNFLLIKDRNTLILSNIKEIDNPEVLIEASQGSLEYPICLEWDLLKGEGFSPPDSPYIAALDAKKIRFPLVLRKWREGDRFRPLGMKGMKKISDYFIDIKLSLVEKEESWILTSGEDIIWLVGHRIDDRYKITSDTGKVLIIATRSAK
jgi:tRNA(Ile)-lysidine synthase